MPKPQPNGWGERLVQIVSVWHSLVRQSWSWYDSPVRHPRKKRAWGAFLCETLRMTLLKPLWLETLAKYSLDMTLSAETVLALHSCYDTHMRDSRGVTVLQDTLGMTLLWDHFCSTCGDAFVRHSWYDTLGEISSSETCVRHSRHDTG